MQSGVHDHATIEEKDAGSAHRYGIDLVWRCGACGYQRQAAARPEGCPGCGAPGSELVGKTSIEWRVVLRHVQAG
ncbi:MAG: hypothetical protein ABR498_00990 [Candidatus Dormibacteria bacterium]